MNDNRLIRFLDDLSYFSMLCCVIVGIWTISERIGKLHAAIARYCDENARTQFKA